MVTVKFIEFEVPPPGAGFVTVTANVPVEAMLAAGMAAVNCEEFTNVVTGAEPPKLTFEAATKFVPLIVSVKAAPPATALFGEIAVIVGAGLGMAAGVGLDVEAVPPPHPAKNTRLTIPKIAHVLVASALLSITRAIRIIPSATSSIVMNIPVPSETGIVS